ncbi:hypothetical protein Pelo_6990 [Pelomyxa schiedti]|nr:hypothetical protein Pelo_6990 [Pelomyxa schiedti]
MTSKLSLLTCQWQHNFEICLPLQGKNADNNQVPLGATAVRCKDNWQNNVQEVKNDFPGVMGQQYAMRSHGYAQSANIIPSFGIDPATSNMSF